MKHIISICLSLLLFITYATSTFAHSHLADSMPKNGEINNEPLHEVSINFDGNIMQGSKMDIQNENGDQVTVSSIEIGDGVLIAKLSESLVNGAYTVNWSIISADGHPLEGSFTFVQDAPITEEVVTEATNEVPAVTEPVENNSTSSNSPVILYVVGGLVVVLLMASSVLLISKRKRK
jgi:copper resistance protein C